MMKLTSRLFGLFLILSLLLPASCGARDGEESAETERVPVTMGEEEIALPAPEEDRKTSEADLPETVMDRCGTLFWNGREIPLFRSLGGETRFVQADAFLEAAEIEAAEEKNGLSFPLGGKTFRIDSAEGDFLVEGDRVGDAARFENRFYIPLEPVAEAAGFARLDDGETVYLTRTVRSGDVPKGVRVPVLMYHAVSDDVWGINELFVRPSEMEKQLKYLVDHGYTTVTFEDLEKIDQIKKPVMLTFDDGYRDNYEELFPLLRKYNCKATIFMIAGKLGKTHYLTEEMLREMADSGLVSIQSHTVSHPKLAEITGERLREELRDSRIELARLTGRIPFVLCYPSGSYNAETRRVGAEYYSFGIKMNGGRYNTSTDPFLIPRHYVSRATSLSAFASLIG